MNRLLLILLLSSSPLNAKESLRNEKESLVFDPTPIENHSHLSSVRIIKNPKHVKSYMIVNGVWMSPVDK